MADTIKDDFLKVRQNENLRNRGQVDHITFKFADYSSSDVTVGASDTLQFKLLNIPKDVVLGKVAIKVKTANGGTLTATLTDGTTTLHTGTFDLNAAGNQAKTVSDANSTFDDADQLYLVFGNNAAIKTALVVEVSMDFRYTTVETAVS